MVDIEEKINSNKFKYKKGSARRGGWPVNIDVLLSNAVFGGFFLFWEDPKYIPSETEADGGVDGGKEAP